MRAMAKDPRPALPGRGLLHLRRSARGRPARGAGRGRGGRSRGGAPGRRPAHVAAGARPPAVVRPRARRRRRGRRGSLLRPDPAPVPDVIGQRGDTGAQIVQNAGFEVRILTVQSGDVPRDRIAPGPAAGDAGGRGLDGHAHVSGGPGEAPVPSVVGQTRRGRRARAARRRLRRPFPARVLRLRRPRPGDRGLAARGLGGRARHARHSRRVTRAAAGLRARAWSGPRAPRPSAR